MKKTVIITLAAILVAITITQGVFAGNINGSEASVIAAASGTFTYDGKKYVSTESSLASLNSYLAQDNIDLTSDQAAEAIAMMNSNILQGINSGYIVPIGANTQGNPGKNDTSGTVVDIIHGTKIINNTKNPAGIVYIDGISSTIIAKDGDENIVFTALLPVKNTGLSPLKTILAKLNQAIVLGAPEYSYLESTNRKNLPSKGVLEDLTLPKVSAKYAVLSCEEIGLSAPLYYGDSDKLLTKGAGQYILSGVPGQGKTILVGGHDVTYFAALENIKEKQEIQIDTYYGAFTYGVKEIKIKAANDLQATHLDQSGEELVLYTCYPFGEVFGSRSKRMFVYCEKISGPTIKEANND